jgi:hypothetical protein
VGTQLNETETTLDLGHGPKGIYEDGNEVYHPFAERHFPLWECSDFRALRDIEAGEEIFDNYLVFGGGQDVDDWEHNLNELKHLCTGGTGRITEYETSKMD